MSIKINQQKLLNKHRLYSLNEEYFSLPNIDNSYWAGFLAADGNINKKRVDVLYLQLQSRDRIQVENLLKAIKSEHPIREYLAKGKYPQVNIAVCSKKLCKDLIQNFNITPNKSLTLSPPKIYDKELIDAFIKGYIDGDGSIGLYKYSKKANAYDLRISILGTESICKWINQRFNEILDEDRILYGKRNNIYVLRLSWRTARTIFLHYYAIPNGIERKWSETYYNFCKSWYNKSNIENKQLHVLTINRTIADIESVESEEVI